MNKWSECGEEIPVSHHDPSCPCIGIQIRTGLDRYGDGTCITSKFSMAFGFSFRRGFRGGSGDVGIVGGLIEIGLLSVFLDLAFPFRVTDVPAEITLYVAFATLLGLRGCVVRRRHGF